MEEVMRGCPVCGQATPEAQCPGCGCNTWDDADDAAVAHECMAHRKKQRPGKRKRATPVERLTAMLEAEGFTGVEINVAQGYYRSRDTSLGTTNWDAFALRDGLRYVLNSYSRVKDCVRYGIVIEEQRRSPTTCLFVWAKNDT